MKFITIGIWHIDSSEIARFSHSNRTLTILFKGDQKEYTCMDPAKIYYNRLCDIVGVPPIKEVTQQ